MSALPSRPAAGFTLIELMIVVAIAGILAAIVYPSFMSQLRQSRRADAVQALTAVQQAQERWRANNATYASNLTASAPTGLGLSSTSQNGYYTISILTNPAPTGSTYSVQAQAVSGKSQASDSGCATLRLNISNGTATPQSGQAACWSN